MGFKEIYYSIKDNSIISILPEYIDLKQWSDAGINQVCIVLDSQNNDQVIHFSGTSSNYERQMNRSFNEIFDQINNFTENKLTILVSLYNHIHGDEILNIISTKNSNGIQFDNLISSNGYLIYHHQLELFFVNEMGFSEKEAVELRKSWNKKMVERKEKIIDNKNFNKLDVLMPFEFVFKKLN